jgi:DUF917 family protein
MCFRKEFRMRRLSKQQLQSIVVGAGLLGAGGGGSIQEGLKLVDRILEFDSGVDLALPQEIADDSRGAVILGMGSPRASLHNVRKNSPGYALELLERTSGGKCGFVIPFELGAGNSMNPMLAAAERKIPIVDGDPAGRAVPELHMTLFQLAGVPITPLVLTTEDRISAVIRTEKPYDAERVARAITSELGGVAAVACSIMQGRAMKDSIIAGTTTLCERIGATIAEQTASGGDVGQSLCEQHGGYLLGRGRIRSLRNETRGGFDFGTVEVEGEMPVRVLFQNENMLAFRGGKVITVVPDLICTLDGEGKPLTNADLAEGMEVTYLGFPASEPFRSAEVFALFRDILKALDFEGQFQPIETLMS